MKTTNVRQMLVPLTILLIIKAVVMHVLVVKKVEGGGEREERETKIAGGVEDGKGEVGRRRKIRREEGVEGGRLMAGEEKLGKGRKMAGEEKGKGERKMVREEVGRERKMAGEEKVRVWGGMKRS